MSNIPQQTSQAYASMLAIRQLEAMLHLGISAEERRISQKVIIDVRIYLPELPQASDDDNGQYICYHGISEKIQALCVQKEYRLIEYLTHEIYRLLRKQLPPEVRVAITLRKPAIQLPYVIGGASYSYSDLPAYSWVAPE